MSSPNEAVPSHNLEVLSRTLGALQQGIITMQTWSEIWKLDLDKEKSYIWSTEARTRRHASELDWKVEQAAKDLGEVNYGKKGQVGTQTNRIQALDGIWPKLKRSLASTWKKQQLLRQAIWPRASYGIVTCTFGWNHIKQMRTEAMKARGYKMAGASPGILCFVMNSVTQDSFKHGQFCTPFDVLHIKDLFFCNFG